MGLTAEMVALLLIFAAVSMHGNESHHTARLKRAQGSRGGPGPAHSTALNEFFNQLYGAPRPSNSSTVPSWNLASSAGPSNVSPILVKPTGGIVHDDPQPSSSGTGVGYGLHSFLQVLSHLSNRPLSDQSVGGSASNGISSGIAAVQETFSQVGSTIQNGLNTVFGVNRPNEVSASASWSPTRPITGVFSSASSPKPSFCPTACTMVCGMPQKASGRIVGGVQVAPANKYPWTGLLQYYGQNVGVGTLINDRVVLTTATIVSSMVIYKHIRVLFGVFDPSSTAESAARKVFNVTKTRLHPQYSGSNVLRYNIGLVQLSVPVTITDSFMPICPPNNVDTFADSDGVLAGWGAREAGGESWKSLQEAKIPLYSTEECQLAYPNATEDNICGGVFSPAPKDQHRTSCAGDDGAGLMYPWAGDPSVVTLVGITVQIPGVGCGKKNEPAVFTKLYAYLPWVQSQASGCYCKSQ